MATETSSSGFSSRRDYETNGRRRAWVKRSPPCEPLRWLTWRERENGSLALVTAHFFRRSADRAAAAYEHDGTMKGWNF